MKRMVAVIIVAMLAVATVACQERIDSPQTVAWDAPAAGFADWYEVALEEIGGEPVIIGEAQAESYAVDLAALGLYGVFVVMVRSVAETEPGDVDRSAWIRSDTDADVLMVDGSPQKFVLRLRRPAGAPANIRVE